MKNLKENDKLLLKNLEVVYFISYKENNQILIDYPQQFDKSVNKWLYNQAIISIEAVDKKLD